MGSSKEDKNLYDVIIKERDQLKEDIERLREELAVTSREKHQSAELGLQLLDQKEELQRRFDDMELEFKLTKQELEEITKAFNNSQDIQKKSAMTGIEQEDKYLEVAEEKEQKFKLELQKLQKELKQQRNELG